MFYNTQQNLNSIKSMNSNHLGKLKNELFVVLCKAFYGEMKRIKNREEEEEEK